MVTSFSRDINRADGVTVWFGTRRTIVWGETEWSKKRISYYLIELSSVFAFAIG